MIHGDRHSRTILEDKFTGAKQSFVLALLDKNGNTMVYLLWGLFMGIVPSVICYFVSDKMPIAWGICLMVSVILFAGSIIFRGRAVAAEFQRRLHL